jgi:hypothetical protein
LPTKPNYPPHLLNSNTNNQRLNLTAALPAVPAPTQSPSDNDKGIVYSPKPIPGLESVGANANSTLDPFPELPTNALESSKQVKAPNETLSSSEGGDSTNYVIVFTIVPIVLLFGVVPIVVASVWLVRKRTRVKKRPTKEMVRKDLCRLWDVKL